MLILFPCDIEKKRERIESVEKKGIASQINKKTIK
jgi:hypothetical protein